MEGLLIPILVGLIVIVVLVFTAILLVLRRRQQAAIDEEPLELLGPGMDYTSMPQQEPASWRDRFSNLSLAGKLLMVIIPLLIIVSLVVVILFVWPDGLFEGSPAATPTPQPVITVNDATLARINPRPEIEIRANSTLPGGTEVLADLLINDEPILWANPATLTTTVQTNGTIQMRLSKAEDTPPFGTGEILVLLRSTLANGQEIVSNPQPVTIPSIYEQVARQGEIIQPTPRPTATATATPEPQPEPEPEPETEPKPTPTPSMQLSDIAGTVSNGGNLRRHPLLIDNVLDQVNAGETVEIIGRTPNAEWYYVRNVRNNVGWVSVTLVTLDAATAARVPIRPIVTVFVTGNVYAQPATQGTPLDQVFVNETVDLLQKTSNEEWYQVRTIRDTTGWVSASLLGIPPEVAADVPTHDGGANTTGANVPTRVSADSGAPSGGIESDTGLTARVFNSGNVRDQPSQDGVPLGEVVAGQSVELLQRTPNAAWYRIRNAQGIEGWVTSSLLTIAPEVVDLVPEI